MGITKESGPGLGFWISLALGAVAGGAAYFVGAGFLVSFVIFVVVSAAMALMLS